jgi:hypothetical protein
MMWDLGERQHARPLARLLCGVIVGIVALVMMVGGVLPTAHASAASTHKPRTASALSWQRPKVIDPTHGGGRGVTCRSSSFCYSMDSSEHLLFFDGSWSSPVKVTTSRGYVTRLLSCSSARFCMAIEEQGKTPFLSHARTFNGSSWSGPLPIHTTFPSGLSCTSRTFCVATGSHASGKRAVTTAVVFRGSSWSGSVTVDRLVNGEASVSCVSPSFCLLLTEGAPTPHEDWAVFDGSSWSAPKSASFANVPAVTCRSASFCFGTTGPPTLAVALFDGSSWTVQTPPSELIGVSCTSMSFCLGVGFRDGVGQSFTFDGTSWSGPTDFDPHDADLDGNEVLPRVSCVSPTFCKAVDGFGFAFTYNGSSWSAPVRFDQNQGTPTDVSCPTSTFCAAVDSNGNVSFLHGSRWSTPDTIDVDGLGLNSVSCTSATFCAAVDEAGVALTFNGSTWTRSQQFANPSEGPDIVTFDAVSCASSTFCVAASSRTPFSAVFDGSTWTGLGNSERLEGDRLVLSCTSPTFCLGVNGRRQAEVFNGSEWSDIPMTKRHSVLNSVSCTSRTSCVAVGPHDSARFTGSRWVELGPVAGTDSVSCVSRSFCVASGGRVLTRYDGSSWSAAVRSGHRNVGRHRDATNYAAVSCATASRCVAVSSTSGEASIGGASRELSIATSRHHVRRGRQVRVSTRLTDPRTHRVIRRARVTLLSHTGVTGRFHTVGTLTTSRSGRARMSVSPRHSTSYEWSYAGTSAHPAAVSGISRVDVH